MTVKILIASYLERDYVEQIRQLDPRLEVIYEPSLIAKPQYKADHKGAAFTRTAVQEAAWRALLKEADILFDFDQTHLEDLPELATNMKWLQATSSGVARFISEHRYQERMPGTVFTNAAGIHAQPLAEFCIMVMTLFNKGFLKVLEDQKNRHWERYCGRDLSNRTLVIVGLGKVGQELARLARQFRMKTIGIKRSIEQVEAEQLNVDEIYAPAALHSVLPVADYLVLIAPHTEETENMLGKEQLDLMPKGSVLINIGRGALVDEAALIDSLQRGHLLGAGLDVFKSEPLPADSPFWDMPNVIVSPHSASTTDNENRLITELFCQNIALFLAGKPLMNVI